MKAETGLDPNAHKKVTFVELFFDLVFVFSVTQVVSLLHHGFSPAAIGQATLVFWLVWWAWTQFTWTLNAADTSRDGVQISVLLATGTAFLMAVAVPQAFGDRALWFAVTYVIVRAIGLGLQYRASFEIPGMRSALRAWLVISLGGLAAVLLGGFLEGAAQLAAWGLAIVVDLVAAATGGRESGWNLKTAHFAERHGLFVIIALGETLIVAASGVSGADWTPPLMTVGILAVLTTCGLWWTYFRGAADKLEAGFEAAGGARQAQIARDAYSLIHFVMLGGVIVYAAAIEEAVAHPSSALEQPGALALGIGIALFTAGMAFALRRATGVLPWPRLLIGLATAAAVALLHVQVSISLGIASAGLLLIGFIERKE